MNIKKYTASALLAAMLVTNTGPWVPMALANPIVPDAGRLGPQMDEARNGTTIVNINTPNGRGLSHNQYDAFNIDNKGAILNNANRPVNTELAGFIMGNPNMVGPTATTILNEVTGTGQTNFNGALEVAGNSAHVIIANPNGIAVNNGTFINANNATLTTGNPIINDGKITGYDIQKGSIAIEGQGLNATKTARTDLLAEAVQLNAKVWAKDTQVVTGQNQVSVDANGKVTNVAKTGNSNEVGLDVSALGGMYANSMYLVGTNDGFGVNNQGVLSAQNKITVDSTGRVVNTGTIATQSADIKAESLEQSNKAKFYASDAKLVVNTLEQKDGSTLLTTNKLDMAAFKLTNTDHSVLKTEGTLHIGKSVDDNGNVIGKIDSIVNHASTIEAGQGGRIDAKTIENRNGGISLKRVQYGDVETVKNEVTAADYPGQTFTLADDKLYHKGDITPDTNHVMLEDENIQFYVDGHGKDDWVRYEYTKTHEKDVVDKSDPARIIAGGDMEVNADHIINDGSQISSAGKLTGTVGHYEGINPEAKEYKISEGTATSYSRHHRDGHDSTNIDPSPYRKVEEVSTKLPVAVFDSNVANSSTDTTIDTAVLNNMSQMATNPNTNYIIETDPNFTNRRNFLSSDYVLQRLKLDPSNVQKRLGDGYYEQQLVMQDILRQTGKSRLQAGLTAEEQYKRLMDNGIKLSKSQSIALGRGLTETEQQQLKEDVVLLVSKSVVLPDGTTQTVLVPTLYVAPTTKRANSTSNSNTGNLQAASILLVVDTMHNSGSIIADNDVTIRGNDIHNEKGLIKGNTTTVLSTGDIRNTQGTIEGNTKTTVYAKQDVINEGGRIKQTDKDGQLVVAAGRDVVNNGKQYVSSDTNIVWDDRNKRRETITSVDQGEIKGAGAILVQADRDVVMKGGTIQSDDSAFVTAKRNVELGTQDASLYVKEDHFHTGKSGGGHKLTTERHDEGTITNAIGSSIEGKQVHIAAANAAEITGSDVLAKDKATIVADTVTFGTAKDSRVETHSYEQKTKSIVSKEQTNKLSHINEKSVQGTTVSGKGIAITSNNDVKGQSVALLGEKVTTIQAGGDIELGADKSVTDSDSAFRRKKSGLLGGAGVGFSIGKEKLNVDESTHEERTAHNSIASTDGAVNIVAGGKVHLTSADIVSKEKSILDGAEVTLDGNTDNTHSSYAESYRKTGLTVSLGGALADNLTTATRTIKQAGGRDDKRLTALELNEARKQLQDGYNAVDKALRGPKRLDANGNVEKVNGHSKRGKKNVDDAINLSISIGSTSRKQSQVVDTDTYQGGTLVSEGDVHIISRDANSKGITLVGEQGQVKTITFDTASNLNLEAGKNTVDVTNTYKNSGWSVGASVSLTSGSLLDINASAHMARQNGDTHQESYVPTAIKAMELAVIKAKHDSNIIGSTVSAKKIKADIGNNLTIQSLQDVDNFKERSKSGGFDISTSPKLTYPVGTVSASIGRIDSKWKSVTLQSGLFAGDEGYDINVGGKTKLEGAVISSKASRDKNQLSTKSLELKDIHNEAEYDARSNGLQYSYLGKNKDKFKEQLQKTNKHQGVIPIGGVGAHGKSSSITKSAISEGNIIVNGKDIDINSINTDVDHSLNQLGQIFDKKKIEERQELARLFSINANEAIHRLAEANKWKDGDARKVALHAFVGGMTSQLGGNSFESGMYASGINEALMPKLKKLVGTVKDADGNEYVDPAALQQLSFILGYATNKTFGQNGTTGAYVAQMGTKHNEAHDVIPTKEQINEKVEEVKKKVDEVGGKVKNEFEFASNQVKEAWKFIDKRFVRNTDNMKGAIVKNGVITMKPVFVRAAKFRYDAWRRAQPILNRLNYTNLKEQINMEMPKLKTTLNNLGQSYVNGRIQDYIDNTDDEDFKAYGTLAKSDSSSEEINAAKAQLKPQFDYAKTIVPKYNIPDINSMEYIDYLMKNMVLPDYFDADGYAHYSLRQTDGTIIELKGYHMDHYKAYNDIGSMSKEEEALLDTGMEVVDKLSYVPYVGGVAKTISGAVSGYKGVMELHNGVYMIRMNNMLYDPRDADEMNKNVVLTGVVRSAASIAGDKARKSKTAGTVGAMTMEITTDEVSEYLYNDSARKTPNKLEANKDEIWERLVDQAGEPQYDYTRSEE